MSRLISGCFHSATDNGMKGSYVLCMVFPLNKVLDIRISPGQKTSIGAFLVSRCQPFGCGCCLYCYCLQLVMAQFFGTGALNMPDCY